MAQSKKEPLQSCSKVTKADYNLYVVLRVCVSVSMCMCESVCTYVGAMLSPNCNGFYIHLRILVIIVFFLFARLITLFLSLIARSLLFAQNNPGKQHNNVC